MYNCDSKFVKIVWLLFKHIRNFHVEVILIFRLVVNNNLKYFVCAQKRLNY